MQAASSLTNFWGSVPASNESGETCTTVSTYVVSKYESTANSIDWFIKNRGGLAFLSGLLLAPSQYMGPKMELCNKIIDGVTKKNTTDGWNVNRMRLPLGIGAINGVSCTPAQAKKHKKCVLYHNPNGVTIAQYFQKNTFDWTPGLIGTLRDCPVYVYDYRGTGLSRDFDDTNVSSSIGFKPTYQTLVDDGMRALKHALQNYDEVEVWGSSLGGGVAAVSTDRFLQSYPNYVKRITFFSHDSFTTTSRVAMPNWPRTADLFGWFVGGHIDAMSSIKSLLERNIKVTVLCHNDDPVIPPGSRLAEYVKTLPDTFPLCIIESEEYGHANLSEDMVEQIRAT